MTEEIKEYLKDNLKIVWLFDKSELYIGLTLEGDVISKIHFERD